MINTNIKLLHQSVKTQIPTHLKFVKVLRLLRFFTKQTIDAIENFFVKKNLCEFDPHVGETACQIRAYQTLLLALSFKSQDVFIQKIKLTSLQKLLIKIEQDIIHYEAIDNKRRDKNEAPITLESFIKCGGYEYELTEGEMFLVYSRLLTYYKALSVQGSSGINYDHLIQDLGVSKENARKLIHIYQARLSEISCDFILKILADIPQNSLNYHLLESLRCMDDDERHVLPCYPTMKVILSHILQTKKNVLLVAQSKSFHRQNNPLFLLFRVSDEGVFFLEKNLSDKILSTPCLVIQGVTQYNFSNLKMKDNFLSAILNLGLEKIILLNMAAHPQYSGKKLQIKNEEMIFSNANELKSETSMDLEREFLFMRQISKIYGCNAQDQKLFYIEHLFCDILKNQINPLPQNISLDISLASV